MGIYDGQSAGERMATRALIWAVGCGVIVLAAVIALIARELTK